MERERERKLEGGGVAAMNHTHATLGGRATVRRGARGGRPTRIKSILYSHAPYVADHARRTHVVSA